MGFPLTRFIQRPLTAYITSTNTASARVSARSITTTMAALLDNFKKPKYPPCGLVPFTEEQVEALLSDPNAIDYSKTKRKGFELWKDIGEPKYVVAPMVDQSEYAWRILSRKYGAHLTFTPMFHARLFSDPTNSNYRDEMWMTGPDDTPVFIQFCGNDPKVLLRAAKMVEDHCVAIDLNLGCPQGIAKKGHYGAFLMDEWDLIAQIVSTLDKHIKIPITCKIRIFESLEKTLAYAKMIEAAGAAVLTVHGRTREQKGHKTGLADWTVIKAIREAVSIPVVANGNILYKEDVDKCIAETGVHGVMIAEGSLYNPALFMGTFPRVCDINGEYLDIVKNTPHSATIGMIRAHMYRLFKPCLHIFPEMRTSLGTVRSLEEFISWNEEIRALLNEKQKQESADSEDLFTEENTVKGDDGFRKLPCWVAQPYVRPPETLHGTLLTVSSKSNTTTTSNEVATEEKENENASTQVPNKRKQSTTNEEKPKRRKTKRSCESPDCFNGFSASCAHTFCKHCCRNTAQEKNNTITHPTVAESTSEPITIDLTETGECSTLDICEYTLPSIIPTDLSETHIIIKRLDSRGKTATHEIVYGYEKTREFLCEFHKTWVWVYKPVRWLNEQERIVLLGDDLFPVPSKANTSTDSKPE